MDDSHLRPRDEITLRDLYLIVRRGAPFIVVLALITAVGAFAYLASRPHVYEASATVQLIAPQPSSTSDLSNLIPQVGFGPQAYASIANSSVVLRTAFPSEPGKVGSLEEVSSSLSLRTLDTSGQARGQLTVEHSARAITPALAAEWANAWAEASAAAARTSMEAAVARAISATEAELGSRRAELDEAQQRWSAFSKDDARVSLRTQIDQLALQQAGARARLGTLDVQIAAGQAQEALLTASIGAREGTSSGLLAEQLRAMADSGALGSDDSADLLAALGQLPAGLTVGGQDLLNLVSRTRLESVTSSLASQAAERSQLQLAAEESERAAAQLRERLADLEQRAADPQAALSLARVAYDRVASVMPLLELQRVLVADAARVVVAAAPPVRAKPRGVLTGTVAAAVVAGLLGTMLVFLRAAVRDPEIRAGGDERDSRAPARG